MRDAVRGWGQTPKGSDPLAQRNSLAIPSERCVSRDLHLAVWFHAETRTTAREHGEPLAVSFPTLP